MHKDLYETLQNDRSKQFKEGLYKNIRCNNYGNHYCTCFILNPLMPGGNKKVTHI